MPVSSLPTPNDDAPMPFDCDTSYNPFEEVFKYFIQLLYLLLGAYLNFSIAWTILWRNRETFGTNPFMILFSMECLVNLILILCDILFVRFLIYFTPVCMPLKDYFSSPLVFFKLIMIVIHHCKVCKSLLQSLLVLNRMTCVLFPIAHSATWRVSLPFIIPAVLIIPLSVDWNLAISRVYMNPVFGGMWTYYTKKVAWASQSNFQLFFIIIALFFTFICTFLTLNALKSMSHRLIHMEKSITYATVISSFGFTVVGGFQVRFALYTFATWEKTVYALSNFFYDFLNVGTPLVMLCVSKTIREAVFKWTKSINSQVEPVPIASIEN